MSALIHAPSGFADGGCAYPPPRQMYGRDQYQVWQTPYAAGCSERVIAACASAIAEMLSEYGQTELGRRQLRKTDLR